MAERAGAIEADLEASLDTSAIEARLIRFERATSTLRLLCTGLFCVLFLALPWVIFRNQFGVYWPHLLAVLIVCVAAIGVVYVRAHGRYFPTIGPTGVPALR